MKSSEERPTIGRSEIADFPDLNIYHLAVKIDTGAYNSSIHCVSAEESNDGELRVIFLDPGHPAYTGEVHRFGEYSRKRVKSSNGQVEKRFMITTSIFFPGAHYLLDLSLANRGDMRFPVLIGRRFLARSGFIIDPKRRNLLGKGKDKRRRKN